MTGLDPTTDSILQISCYITDARLTLLDPTGYHATITTPPSTLLAMSPWCTATHTASGLVAACQSPSSIPAPHAAADLLSYIQRYVPAPRVALLAGNSVHADRMFLARDPWTPVVEWLHYRILDVSAIKEGVRRWCGEGVVGGVPRKKLCHTAGEDVRESIEEGRYYMGLFERLGRGEGGGGGGV